MLCGHCGLAILRCPCTLDIVKLLCMKNTAMSIDRDIVKLLCLYVLKLSCKIIPMYTQRHSNITISRSIDIAVFFIHSNFTMSSVHGHRKIAKALFPKEPLSNGLFSKIMLPYIPYNLTLFLSHCSGKNVQNSKYTVL